MWWVFDSNFPRGSIYFFDVNFLELCGTALLGPLCGWVSDSVRHRLRRRGLSIAALLLFIVGFGCQLAYRDPLDDPARWTRDLMAPAYIFVQLAATLLEIASRAVLTDFGFAEGHARAHAVGGAMSCLATGAVYAAVRVAAAAPTEWVLDHGWDGAGLRYAQIGLAIGSGLGALLSTLSGETAECFARAPPWRALFNVDACPNFWRIALPYGLVACAWHQLLIVTPAMFHLYLWIAIDGYVGGFWLGFVALVIASAAGAAGAAAAAAAARRGWMRAAFAIAETGAGLLLAAFSYACWEKASLTAVYGVAGIGLGFLRVVPFAMLGADVPRDQVGRCVSLMVSFGVVCEQIVQGNYWDNSMDIYYPWPHVWILLVVGGLIVSGVAVREATAQVGEVALMS
jgi:hypothetical protein